MLRRIYSFIAFWLEKKLPETLQNATAIMTISEFSKKEIIEVFNIKEEKITIIPPAVSNEFRQHYSVQQVQKIRQTYQLPQQFILSVATIEPRKNLKGLLEAYKILPEALKNTYPLVVVGCNGWLSTELEPMMRSLVAKGQLIRLGYVPQQHLPIIYAAASLFIYVSHYEGYGMPIAEAMCSGVPIITSNISSMPEVAAGCAELIEPDNIEQVTLEIQELLENKLKRETLIASAKIKSAEYTWDTSARKLFQLFSRCNNEMGAASET